MKQFFAFALSLLLLLCCGCSAEPAQAEAAAPEAEETVSNTEVPQTQHIHTFGNWEAAQTQMQRLCAECGETELRNMTDEEQFYSLLRGRWEPYEVTFLDETQLVYYLRNNVWYVYADYTGGDTLTYSSAMTKDMLGKFSRDLTLSYSHFDTQSNTHHAAATDAEGLNYQIALDISPAEPLLYITPEQFSDPFDRVVFSRYEQVVPVVVGTWSGFNNGTIGHITLNEDLTFTSNIAPFTSGTWQVSPADGSKAAAGGIQLFYEENNRPIFTIGTFYEEPSNLPEVEADQLDLSLYIYTRQDPWTLRKLQPEQLEPLIDKGANRIIGTWDSKSTRSLSGADTTTHIQTGYTLTVNEDGTFTMTAGKKVTGTWTANGTTLVNGNSRYKFLFTYPGCGKNGDDVTIIPESDTLSFAFKQGNSYTYLHFAQYSEDQWRDYLAGPDLLPGHYVSQKIVRYDKETGAATEQPETGYTLTIRDDGTVDGTLHKGVTGTWFYNDVLFGEGHNYIFRMDHTPPEQLSVRKVDGTLVFDTKLDGEHVEIYFYPQ